MAATFVPACATSAAVVSCARMTNDPGLVRLPSANLSTTPVKRVTTSLVRSGTPEDSASQVVLVTSGPLADPPQRRRLRVLSVRITNATSVATGAGAGTGGVVLEIRVCATASLVPEAPPCSSTYFLTSESSPPG